MMKRLENLFCEEREECEGVMSFLSGEEEPEGSGGTSSPVLNVWPQKGSRLSLHKEPHGKWKMQETMGISLVRRNFIST